MNEILSTIAIVISVGVMVWNCWRMRVALRRFEAAAADLERKWAEEEAALDAALSEGKR